MRVNPVILFSIFAVGCAETVTTPTDVSEKSNVDCTVPHAQHIYAECAGDTTTVGNVGNFSVVSSTPANLGTTKENPAKGIALNQTFVVNFHHSFNRQSVTRSSVRIMPTKRFASGFGVDPEADEDLADHNDVNAIIDANTVLTNDDKTFTITPVQALRPNTAYHLMFNVLDAFGSQASGTLHFHTILNPRISREEYDRDGVLDEKFIFTYDADGTLVKSIKWDVGNTSHGYIRKEGIKLPVTVNGATTDLQTERVEYKNEVAPGTTIPESQLEIKSIRLRKEISVANVTSNSLVDFRRAGTDGIWGTSDDETGFVSLPGLNHDTHLMTNYYRGKDPVTGELSSRNYNPWPAPFGATTPLPLQTMETVFGYGQSIARQYRTSDRQIELRVDYRKLAGSVDPVTGITGPFTAGTRFSPQFQVEEIDDYRMYVYNPDGRLVLRVDVNPRYGANSTEKKSIRWTLDGSETYVVNKAGSPLHNQTITAIDDYRVYKYNINGQLDRYIEYEEDNDQSNSVSLTPGMIAQFRAGTLTADTYFTDDKVDEEEVYEYDPATGGLKTRIEYHGAASAGIKADVDQYNPNI